MKEFINVKMTLRTMEALGLYTHDRPEALPSLLSPQDFLATRLLLVAPINYEVTLQLHIGSLGFLSPSKQDAKSAVHYLVMISLSLAAEVGHVANNV